MKSIILVALAAIGLGSEAFGSNRIPFGGGILHAGLRGEYFDNADLAGKPRYERKDVRVRFDWGDLLPVLGTRAENLADFPRDNFSVRWTGQVMARFDEVYTFKLISDECARLYLKPADATEWKPVVDAWRAHTRREDTGEYALKANVPYDVKLEYRNLAGPASIELRWSSPSTPEELLDTHSVANIATTMYMPVLTADAFKGTSAWNSKEWKTLDGQALTQEQRESSGWPKCDAQTRTGFLHSGRHLVRFTGKAEVTMGVKGAFIVDGKEIGKTLPAGTGYDAKTNTTTADWKCAEVASAAVKLAKTQRNADAPLGSGITGFILMRPVEPDANAFYAPGTMVNNGYKRFIENYVNVREYAGINGKTWNDRSQPGDHDQYRARRTETGGALENYILMANETGRDLYLNINNGDPPADYLRKAAQVIRYGSNGVEPYTQATANPVYPPLNSNLRVYLEFMNEIWNYGGVDGPIAHARENNTLEWRIINHDGRFDNVNPLGGWNAQPRWQGLQTVRISNAFREVFGDPAMCDKVRVLAFGQYDRMAIWHPIVSLIDTYFNNGDGKQHVKDPHPVNWFVWGGGGALYYGSNDPTGTKGIDWIKDGDFETPALKKGEISVRPRGTAWTFDGPAGIATTARPIKSLAHKFTAGRKADLPVGTFAGCQFSVGAKDIYVYEVGGYLANAKSAGLGAAIYDKAGKDVTPSSGAAGGAGDRKEFGYRSLRHTNAAAMRDPRPIRLKAGQTYYLMAGAGADMLGDDTQITPPNGIAIDGAVTASSAGKNGLAEVKITRPGAFSFGPLDIVFTDEPIIVDGKHVGVSPWKATDGQQCLFMAVGGKATQKVAFVKAGVYALSYKISGSANVPSAALLARLDDQEIAGGRYGAPEAFMEGASEIFEIKQPGEHRITLEAKGTGEVAGLFIDRLRVSSVENMFGGPELTNIPGAGDADGELKRPWVERSMVQVNEATSWGLVPSSYEGGWAVGGDRGRTAFMNYCNFVSPLAIKAEARAMDAWTSVGGYEFQRHYQQIPGEYNAQQIINLYNAIRYPLPRGVIEYNKRLPAMPTANGDAIPAKLKPASAKLAAGPTKALTRNITGELDATKDDTLRWISWNLLVPRTAEFTLSVIASGDADLKVLINGSQQIAQAKAGKSISGKVRLTPGMHSVQVRAMSGKAVVESVEIK